MGACGDMCIGYARDRLPLYSCSQAEQALEYAFVHCHRSTPRNRLRVLQFLVPIKLLVGKMPQVPFLKVRCVDWIANVRVSVLNAH